jgi:cell division protein FtsW (lipid II flippase)
MLALIVRLIPQQLVPIGFGLFFIGMAIFSSMDQMRDGTRITDPKRRLRWRLFFFVLGLLAVFFGAVLESAA